MDFKKLFSIITTCHNRWHHLKETWISWTNQDYPRLELIIVSSGNEEPKSLINDSRFKGRVLQITNLDYFRPSLLRNIGAAYALGEYFAFVDADNFLNKSWLSYCAEQLDCKFDLVINELLLNHNDPGGSSGTLAISRWLFEKIRGYNTNLDRAWGYEDTDLIVRAQRAGGRVAGYPHTFTSHIDHSDVERQKYFKSNLPPRLPKIFINQMKICDLDYQVHPFEANRVRRFQYPDLQVTEYSR